jgi:hypothetical protein
MNYKTSQIADRQTSDIYKKHLREARKLRKERSELKKKTESNCPNLIIIP